MAASSDIRQDRIMEKAREWLVLLDSGAATVDDVNRFRSWQAASKMHSKIFEQERALWHDVGQLVMKTNQPPTAKKTPRITRRAMWQGGIAVASVAIAAPMVPKMAMRFQADYLTQIGEQATIDLPDGTRMWMNTDTAVDFDAAQRRLHLMQGEVMFRVSSLSTAQPFTAIAGQRQACSQSGEFALRYDSNHAQLTTLDAKVELIGTSGIATLLPPNRQMSWHDGAAAGEIHKIEQTSALAWRDGKVIFDAEPFEQAAYELARYLPEKLILRRRAKLQTAVSGRFEIADARDALAALAKTQGLKIRRFSNIAIVIF